MRKTNRVLAAIAALVLALGLVAAFNTSASAAPSTAQTATTSANLSQAPAARQAARRNFGAIHVNFYDGTGGYSYDKATKRKAKKASKRMCRANSTHDKHCNLAVWVRNGCAAVAVRVKNHRVVEAKSAIAFTKKAAVRKAKNKVGKKVRKKPYAWVCTTRYR